MAHKNWPLITRLKRAVRNINFIITFNLANAVKLASKFSRSSSSKPRRLSFNDRHEGLKAAARFDTTNYHVRESSSGGSSAGRELHRSCSCPVSDEDVDDRAEAFITNFYRQLRMERQISLQLRYCRADSFDSARSP